MERKNVSINGVGSCGSGKYDHLSVNGSARCNGDIDCIQLEVNGKANFNDELICEDLQVNGLFNSRGKTFCKSINVAGASTFKDEVETDKLNVAGRVKIHKSLNAKDINLEGSLTIGDNIIADKFKGTGVFNIIRDINCKNIDIGLKGTSNVRNIKGESINIYEENSHKTNILDLFFVGKNILKVDTVEGNDITLTNTTAKVIKGNNVTLRKGCKIDVVQYKDELSIQDGAVVKKSEKIV